MKIILLLPPFIRIVFFNCPPRLPRFLFCDLFSRRASSRIARKSRTKQRRQASYLLLKTSVVFFFVGLGGFCFFFFVPNLSPQKRAALAVFFLSSEASRQPRVTRAVFGNV